MREEEGSRDRREAGEKMGMNVGGLLQEGGRNRSGAGREGGEKESREGRTRGAH